LNPGGMDRGRDGQRDGWTEGGINRGMDGYHPFLCPSSFCPSLTLPFFPLSILPSDHPSLCPSLQCPSIPLSILACVHACLVVISKILQCHRKAEHSLFTSATSNQRGCPEGDHPSKGSPSPVANWSEGAEQMLRRVSFRLRIGRWRIEMIHEALVVY
jgi:hypothetical protein